MKPINTVIVKTSTSCNLACVYCYATDRTGKISSERILSRDTLEMLIKNSMLAAGNKLEFIWHGGEPLIVGMKFYQDVLEFQKKYSRPDVAITNSLQTNATLITPKWAAFLAENSIGAGVSLDGPKHIHNSTRKIGYGKDSFELTMRGISYLTEKNMRPSLLAVVSKHSLEHTDEIFDFFVENSLLNFEFLPYAEFSESGELEPLSITPDEFGYFMIKIYDIWMRKNNPNIQIRLLHNAMLGMLGGAFNLCTMNGTCANFFAIGPAGDVYHCDWFIGQKDDCFGNINNETFDEISNKPAYNNYVALVRQEKKECKDCKWLSLCNGGCSHHRKIMGGFDKPYYFCQSRKMLFEHMETHLSSLQVNTSNKK